jgi:ABC-type transport system substrate-binding protein
VPAIMPERLAAESPFKPVAEIVGSGPFRYLKDEHVSGACVVFERFAEYRPRAAEGPAGALGFTSGPKVAHFDRVEWLTLDPFSASAALKRGEIDWWENPARDLVGQVSSDPNITVVSHFATAPLRFRLRAARARSSSRPRILRADPSRRSSRYRGLASIRNAADNRVRWAGTRI